MRPETDSYPRFVHPPQPGLRFFFAYFFPSRPRHPPWGTQNGGGVVLLLFIKGFYKYIVVVVEDGVLCGQVSFALARQPLAPHQTLWTQPCCRCLLHGDKAGQGPTSVDNHPVVPELSPVLCMPVAGQEWFDENLAIAPVRKAQLAIYSIAKLGPKGPMQPARVGSASATAPRWRRSSRPRSARRRCGWWACRLRS